VTRTSGAQGLDAVFAQLDAMHTWRGWHWWPDADPFEVCVGCILVQNTSWTNVERALDVLRPAGLLNPGAMARLSPGELEAHIRSSGQYRQKARKLRAFLDLIAAHGSLDELFALPVEDLRSELLATWGIGPETADAMIVYAARKPAFVIDNYTIRVFSRLGMGPASSDYHEWQQFLTANVPEDRDTWARYHALIVLHAKHLCTKNRPRCADCTLSNRCPAAESGCPSPTG
jgi:endonuclease III related protein